MKNHFDLFAFHLRLFDFDSNDCRSCLNNVDVVHALYANAEVFENEIDFHPCNAERRRNFYRSNEDRLESDFTIKPRPFTGRPLESTLRVVRLGGGLDRIEEFLLISL